MILNVETTELDTLNLADLVDEGSQFGSIGVTKVTRSLGVRLAHYTVGGFIVKAQIPLDIFADQ